MALSDENQARANELYEIVAGMIGRDLRDDKFHSEVNGYPFDIEPENFHRSKRDYLEELDFVRTWLGQLDKFEKFLSRDTTPALAGDELQDLVEYLNGWARSYSKYDNPGTGQELAVSSVMRVGLVPCFLLLNQRIREILESRLELLERQGKDYWSVDHRPPNYHARTIALRLARLFSREMQSFPTMGTSGETGAPSTKYARALKEVFRVLSVGADFRSPGEWAISQLSEGDFKPDSFGESLNILRQLAEGGYLKKRSHKDLSKG